MSAGRQWIVFVRNDDEEERLFGPYRNLARAHATADELNAKVTDDKETPAWAYVVDLEPSRRFRLRDVGEWLVPAEQEQKP